MKIKILNTEEGFDPSASCSPSSYEEALDGFEAQLEAEIVKIFPDAEVEFYRGNDEYGSPTGHVEVVGVSDMDDSESIAEQVAAISEMVFETGLFWN